MTIFRNLLLAVCAGLPLAAMAAPASNPADQAAFVPPVVYQSAVATYHGAPEQDKSPDETWRDANQRVGKAASQPGKMDQMGPMQHMSMKGMKGMNGMPDMDDDAKETKAPKDPKEPKDPAAADPHRGHDMGQMHDMKQMQHGQ